MNPFFGANIAVNIAVQVATQTARMAATNSSHHDDPENKPPISPVPLSDDVIKEELAALGPSPGMDFSSHPLKEDYQHILNRNPEWILGIAFVFKIGNSKTQVTPKSMTTDPDNGEVFYICDLIDENGARMDRFQQASFLEDIYAGNMMPLEDPTAFAAKILLMDSLKQKA
jgi:hypothetical protein